MSYYYMSYNNKQGETNSQTDHVLTIENCTCDHIKQISPDMIQIAKRSNKKFSKRSKKISNKKYQLLCKAMKMFRLLGVTPNSHKDVEILYQPKDHSANTDGETKTLDTSSHITENSKVATSSNNNA